MSADAMIVASYLGFGSVPEWKGVEIKYTRKSKESEVRSRVEVPGSPSRYG